MKSLHCVSTSCSYNTNRVRAGVVQKYVRLSLLVIVCQKERKALLNLLLGGLRQFKHVPRTRGKVVSGNASGTHELAMMAVVEGSRPRKDQRDQR